MMRALLVCMLAAVAALETGCRPVPNAPGTWGHAAERELVARHNEERTARGLPALVVDDRLELAAALRVADMVEGGYDSHRDPDGVPGEYWQILGRWGLSWIWAGENLTRNNYEDPVDRAMTSWMASDPHRANVLYPHFERVGCATWHGEERRTWMVCIYAWGLE